MSDTPIIEMEHIDKSFVGNQVLSDVHFDIQEGEIHALMGENGAGKSTLIKVLTGIHPRDSGIIRWKGEEVKFSNPKEAEKEGIIVIHQELNIIPYLTVAENMFLGKELTYGKSGIIKSNEMKAQTKGILDKLGVKNIQPNDIAGNLSVGKQQMVEIARALATEAKVIIMDEPTAALTEREIRSLFNLVQDLKKQGVSFVYISHRMEEIFEICDRITVLRDGSYVGTRMVKETNLEAVVKMMVGRELGQRFPEKNNYIGDVILSVENFSSPGWFDNVTFDVRKGEILGVSGLMGAGRSEVMEALFGYRKSSNGHVKLDGKPLKANHPKNLIKQGIGFITEDRKVKGLMLEAPIRENITLANFKRVSKNQVIQTKKERELVNQLIKRLNVKATNSEQQVKSLSGGNQQKVVVAKWLGIEPKVLILDEPTRGVDIGAKKEIYTIINELAENGVAIIMVSSELQEILGVSDRVMVMHEGKVKGFFDRNEATQEKIMLAATGGE
ncbi:sugar ABC transporter ATP-binding protein [Paraliobacillus salinarum]|uniref:sugar ABC transporter ATP-binding protein n=1 Tax=Paraliobacillus salinarum TaxID=1158996 RepID=UPI0015F5AC20|nr:sugar ABC transporter ATP-binding protein [Paraliobacillus salinarum]